MADRRESSECSKGAYFKGTGLPEGYAPFLCPLPPQRRRSARQSSRRGRKALSGKRFFRMKRRRE